MDEEVLAGMGEDMAEDPKVKKKGAAKVMIEDDSLLNELNFCFVDANQATMSAQID